MPRCRVVVPSIVRLPLSDGDWIDVQNELNAGEYYDFLNAMAARQPFAKILAYVFAWSLIGLDDKPLPYSLELEETVRRDTIRGLQKETTKEIIAVLDRHEAAQDAARAAKKKTPAIAPTSSPTSPSVTP